MNKQQLTKKVFDESPEWTAEDFANARPANEILAEIFSPATANAMLKPRGRPRVAFPKERVTIRLSHEVLSTFRATGRNWQTRLDRALHDYIHANLITTQPTRPTL